MRTTSCRGFLICLNLPITRQAPLYPLAASALTAVIGNRRRISEGLRGKFRNGKRHRTEKRAGIILLCRYTLLVGDHVLGRLNEILRRSYESNDREDPKGYKEKVSTRRRIGKRAVQTASERFGNIRAAATALAAALTIAGAFLNYLRLKNDRIDCFHSCPFVGIFTPLWRLFVFEDGSLLPHPSLP